jgi:hypothetical protein
MAITMNQIIIQFPNEMTHSILNYADITALNSARMVCTVWNEQVIEIATKRVTDLTRYFEITCLLKESSFTMLYSLNIYRDIGLTKEMKVAFHERGKDLEKTVQKIVIELLKSKKIEQAKKFFNFGLGGFKKKWIIMEALVQLDTQNHLNLVKPILALIPPEESFYKEAGLAAALETLIAKKKMSVAKEIYLASLPEDLSLQQRRDLMRSNADSCRFMNYSVAQMIDELSKSV